MIIISYAQECQHQQEALKGVKTDSVVHTGKPEDKKEKGGDKADDKVRAVTLTNCSKSFY